MDIEKGDVASHYGSPELVERILASLSEAGKSLDSLTVNDFASFDNLHPVSYTHLTLPTKA